MSVRLVEHPLVPLSDASRELANSFKTIRILYLEVSLVTDMFFWFAFYCTVQADQLHCLLLESPRMAGLFVSTT